MRGHDMEHMLDIHSKCRREREELKAQLAEAREERDALKDATVLVQCDDPDHSIADREIERLNDEIMRVWGTVKTLQAQRERVLFICRKHYERDGAAVLAAVVRQILGDGTKPAAVSRAGQAGEEVAG